MPPVNHRPPLAVSPRRLRPRHNLRPVPCDRTPPASIRTKPKILARSSLPCEKMLRPGLQLISSELMEMAKRAEEEFADLGTSLTTSDGYKPAPLFERGRFYELYSARRNERLKRKQEEFEFDDIVAQDPGIAVELAKRRNSKKAEGLRKSVPVNFSVSRAGGVRSSLRSSKEIKKAAAVVGSCVKKSAADARMRIGTRSVLRI